MTLEKAFATIEEYGTEHDVANEGIMMRSLCSTRDGESTSAPEAAPSNCDFRVARMPRAGQ
jgi:hypothetical protein